MHVIVVEGYCVHMHVKAESMGVYSLELKVDSCYILSFLLIQSDYIWRI